MTTGLEHYLTVGAILFSLGMIGFLTRRNLILIMLSAEMMLHGVSINLTAFSQFHKNHDGQVFTAMILTIAACEAGLSLAIILAIFQRKKSLDVRLWTALGEEELMPPLAEAPLPVEDGHEAPHPKLTPAGRMPVVSANVERSAVSSKS